MDSELRERDYSRDSNGSVIHKARCSHFKCISWSAVLTGALIGIGISFIFNLFAMGIGLAAFSSATANPKSIAIGGVIGLLLITIFSMGTAGWVAGYLGRPKSLHRDLGVIYGFTAWCVALVLMIALSANVGKFVYYNLAALQNPTYIVTNGDTNKLTDTTNVAVTSPTAANPQMTSANPNQNVVTDKDAAKALSITTFLAFVLAFIGGLSSCLGGHWGFRSSEKDILYYKNRDTRVDV